ncbi:hypothetical protein DL95DRAFT_390216 [Leptodontidium sp. 2 PMI_412]|nr:hypothetical protein DL95DRAFT_390216 [Leptodontidium sp. 2 PMI_412]
MEMVAAHLPLLQPQSQLHVSGISSTIDLSQASSGLSSSCPCTVSCTTSSTSPSALTLNETSGWEQTTVLASSCTASWVPATPPASFERSSPKAGLARSTDLSSSPSPNSAWSSRPSLYLVSFFDLPHLLNQSTRTSTLLFQLSRNGSFLEF